MSDAKKPKAPLTIRVEVADLEGWTRCANLRGLSISEWVRRACNAWAGGQEDDRRRAAHQARKIVESETESAATLEKQQSIAETVFTTGQAIAHDPRCSCFACKPPKEREKGKS